MLRLSDDEVRIMENDGLLSALHITSIGYFPSASLHEIHREIGVPQYIFIYCVRGKGWYEVEGKRYEIEPNQYFIIPKGKAHNYGADRNNPWTIYWIHFAGTLAKHYAENAAEPKEIRPEQHSRISNRQNLFEEIYTTLCGVRELESLSFASSLFHYYLGSLRYIQQYRSAVGNNGFPLSHDTQEENGETRTERGLEHKKIVDALRHYMEENKEKRLTLEQLARYCGYSISHLSLMFREQTGESPIEYFNSLKMKEACWLLENTDMKVNQISFKLGFDDAYYFSRLFTKMMGVSPKAWRKPENR